MPIKLQEMLQRTRVFEMTFQGENLKVEYRINVVTPAFLAQVDKLSTRESLIMQIETVVERWELLDENGKELQPTRELLEKLPTDFLAEVLNAIVADMGTPGAEEKKG